MRAWLGLLMCAAVAAASVPVRAQDAACAKSDFEAVVDSAAAALRDLNLKHRPAFQEKLRSLKVKRGWNDDQFLKEAAPFVKDDATDAYDAKSNELLAKITAMGQSGAEAKTPDCALMAELTGHMQALVQAQTDKWKYLSDKLAAELAK